MTAEPTIDIARAQAIVGWMHRGELRWLADHASRADIVVEVGAWLGRSTRALADHVRGRVFVVDPWDGYTNDDGTIADWMLKRVGGSWETAYDTFRANLADHLETRRVIAVRKPSATALPSLRGHLKAARADLVFIDGDHRAAAVEQDIDTYRRILRPGGILAGHDYGQPDWPGVQEVVDRLFDPATVGHYRSIWWVTV